MSTFISK
jgi:hypothetical protein